MTKISVTGPKTQLEPVVDKLHILGVMDLDEYDGDLETGDPMEGSEDISELLVDIRSLQSKLDAKDSEEASIGEVREAIPKLSEKVKKLERRKEEVERELEELIDEKKFYKKLEDINIDFEGINFSEHLDYKILEFDAEKFGVECKTTEFEVFEGENCSVLVYNAKESEAVEEALHSIKTVEHEFHDSFTGTPKKTLKQIESEISSKKSDLNGISDNLAGISSEWGGKLNYVENYLTEKIEKAEAPLNFATTESSFIAEGWIPSKTEQEVRDSLNSATDSKIHIHTENGGEPPVKYNNNKLVQPFESLTDLVSRPKYGELDPSILILLTFPLFFGLMIGDAGYGISSALVFYGGMKMFPQAAALFKALLWTSASTFIFGLLYGEMFGFQIYESPFYRADWWTEIFYLTIGIGVAHVNLGLLIGAYNEYIHHGVMEAIFTKISWIFLQIAAVTAYLVSVTYGATPGYIVGFGIGIPTILMMYKGEGIEAIVEIPSLISNILSYLRLFGVCMAAYTLAGTVNAIAGPALASGTMMGMAGGTLILIFGHVMLTFVKIMEGFLQGIRLHYVEQFGWFYEGGGRKYNPFGGEE